MTIRYSSLTGLSGICLAIWMLVGTPLTVTGAGDSDAPTVGESRQTRSLNGVWKFCAPMEELEYRHEFLQDGLV